MKRKQRQDEQTGHSFESTNKFVCLTFLDDGVPETHQLQLWLQICVELILPKKHCPVKAFRFLLIEEVETTLL